LLALAVTAFLAGLAGVFVRLRREFPLSISVLTVALLAGATPLAYLTFFAPAGFELLLFAAGAWLGVVAGSPAAAQSYALRVAAWLLLAAVILFEWPFRVWPSRPSDVLFSSWHGFLSWTPVAYAGLIGTIAYVRRNRTWALGALILVLASASVVGAGDGWVQEQGLSPRRMTPVFAVLAPGLAYVLDVMRRRPAFALAPLVIAPLVWNHLLMVQYTIGLLPKDEPVSFARLVRQQPEAHARTSGFYPFAFPANVWFAWREGVPVDRYDLLAVEPRRETFDLVFDRRARRYLLDGWDAPGMEAASPLWWIRDRNATVAVPLAIRRDRPIEITVRARSRFEEPVMQSDLSLLVNGQSVGDFSPRATSASDLRFVVPAAQPFWRNGINRLTFASRGTHRVDGADTRPPGPIARRRGNAAWPVAIYWVKIRPLD
jgi:hypothetical protein